MLRRAITHAASRRPKGPQTVVELVDASFPEILDAHKGIIAEAQVKKSPATRADVEAAFHRFLTRVFGGGAER